MGSQEGVPTIARQAAEYLKQRYAKPGNVFVGVVSRIDRLVSGVLVLARTSKAAGRLSEQIRQRSVEKRYLALVEGGWAADDIPQGKWIELSDNVAKDERMQRMKIVPETSPQAQPARLRLRPVTSQAGVTLLEVDLLTGRKHQIRLQLSHAGFPILGDSKYGSTRKFANGIALHCQRLQLTHPTKKERMTFTAPVACHWPSVSPEFLKGILAG